MSSMWQYWRDKYGHVDAVGYFAPEIQQRADVQQAIAMIKNGERALDKIFEELEESENE